MIREDLDTLEDPIVTPNSLKVLENRYLAKNNNGKITETPKEMYLRVAKHIASCEEREKARWTKIFYNMMARNEFMPNSPTLMNAGRRMGMLSACFVLPVEDDINGIFDSIKATALVQKAGGGTGFSFNNLRPSGSIVKSSGGTTAGPLSFIDVFSSATTAIQQGAFRRGANMGILNVEHPDIVQFIMAKSDLNRWQNYNVSIAVTDQFMTVLRNAPNCAHLVRHKEWGEGFLWKDKKTGEVVAIKKDENTIDNTTDFDPWTIKETWDLICQRAWETGEPGLFFIDKANHGNPIPNIGRITATNPCGEQPLHDFDSCNLGSINLTKFVLPLPANYKSNKWIDCFDWEKWQITVDNSVRFLDNVIQVNNYPIPEIEAMGQLTRRIGLGVMGFADILFYFGIPYHSDLGREVAKVIGDSLNLDSFAASQVLALERGNFGAHEGSIFNGPMRNSYRTTIAPTGTISIISNCSGGIEPAFALAFKREVMLDDKGVAVEMTEFNPYFKTAIEALDINEYDKTTIYEYALKHGSIQDIDVSSMFERTRDKIRELKEVFKTSHDLEWDEHVRMQAAWQENIDSAVSKTINLRHDSSPADISQAYHLAWELDCKGITVYRDGSRDGKAGMVQPMKTNARNISEREKRVHTDSPVGPIDNRCMENPNASGGATPENLSDIVTNHSHSNHSKVGRNNEFLPAVRTRIKTPWGNLHVCIVLNHKEEEHEIFAQLGKSGDAISADLEGMCRMASLYLRGGGSLEDIIEQWSGIGSTTIMPSANGKMVSIPDALAKALMKYLEHKNQKEIETKTNDHVTDDYGTPCPSCNKAKLIYSEGCKKCNSCGFSEC